MNIYTYNIYINVTTITLLLEIFINVQLLLKKLLKVKDRSSFLVEIMNFKGKIKPQNPEKK